MRKSVEMGAVVLIFSGIICKFFGALFRLPLTNIIGIEGIGIFQMIMSLYSLVLVLVTGGVTVTLSKLISSARAVNDYSKIKCVVRSSLIFSLGLGALLSILFSIFAKQISSLQGIGESFPCYWLFLILVPASALIGVFRGTIQGYENMIPTAVSQIIEQVFKFVFGLLFAYIFARGGAWHGVFGAFIGIVLSEIFAFIYLMFHVFKKVHFVEESEKGYSKEFFYAVVHLTFSNSIMPLTNAFDSLIIVSRLVVAGFAIDKATALFGLQTGVVGAILNFPLIISVAVATALLPKLSYLSKSGDVVKERDAIQKNFSLMWYLLLPLVFGVMATCSVLYPIIYPTAIKGFLSIAIELTFWGGISAILSAIMQFSIAILQAKGNFKYYLSCMIMGGIAKILIVYFLASVKEIGVIAIPLASIAFSLIVIIMILIKLRSIIKLYYFDVLTPLLASIAMYLALRIFSSVLKLGNIFVLTISVFVGGVIYLVLTLPLLKKYYKLIKVYLSKRA